MHSARFVQHKMNIQKSTVLLSQAINNLKSEIKKTTELTVSQNKICRHKFIQRNGGHVYSKLKN